MPIPWYLLCKIFFLSHFFLLPNVEEWFTVVWAIPFSHPIGVCVLLGSSPGGKSERVIHDWMDFLRRRFAPNGRRGIVDAINQSITWCVRNGVKLPDPTVREKRGKGSLSAVEPASISLLIIIIIQPLYFFVHSSLCDILLFFLFNNNPPTVILTKGYTLAYF